MNSFAASRPEMLASRKETQSVLHVEQIVRLLRRNAWGIGICTVLGGGSAFIFAHTLPKTYTANGLMTVEGDRMALPELQGVLKGGDGPDPFPFVHTEVQALTSRSLNAQVVSELHLERDPEFNADLRSPTLWKRVSGLIGSMLARLLPHATPGTGDAAAATEEGVIGAAQKALSVFQDNKSLVISISFVSKNPVLASRYVNTLIANYVNSRAQHRVDANQGAGVILSQRAAQARADLVAVQKQEHDLRDSSSFINLRAGSVGQQQVEELTSAAATAAVQRSQLEATYARALSAQKAGNSDTLASVLDSPTVSRLRDEEATAEGNVAQLSAHYGPKHPAMRIAEAQLRSSRQELNGEVSRIVSSLGAQLRVAREQDDSIRRQLNAARSGAITAENAQAQLDQLQQEEVTRQALYRNLLEQSQQAMAQPAADATPDVRILSPAVPPVYSSGPHTALIGVLGACASGLLAVLGGLTRMRAVKGFESADALNQATGTPVLATVSRRMLSRSRPPLPDGLDAEWRRPGQAHDVAEAMRVIRNRLRFAGWSNVPRTALFVPDASSAGGQLAIQLATTFAQVAAADGARVLLVDADLNAPGLRDYLGFPAVESAKVLSGAGDGSRWQVPRGAQPELHSGPSSSGLLAVFNGRDWRDAIIASDQPGLDLLLVDQPVRNAHALTGGVTFQNLLVECAADYNLVVLLGSAAGTADAETLVQRVDAAVMVVDQRGNRALTERAVESFTTVARTPLFSVLVSRL